MSEQMKLTTFHILFTVKVTSSLVREPFCGSALRGSLFQALWNRFCQNKEAETCARCPLHEVCPVSSLVAPLREHKAEHVSYHGRDVPRPFVILPPLEEKRHYEPDEIFQFHLTLLGNVQRLLPYLILSLSDLERQGFGRPLRENNGARGQYQVQRLEIYHPFYEQRDVIYQRGEKRAVQSAIRVTASDVEQRVISLKGRNDLKLEITTPMRIQENQKIQRSFAFLPFLHRLFQRLNMLEQEYGSGDIPYPMERINALLHQAESVICEQNTTWVEVYSNSRRLQQLNSISGFQGSIRLCGDLDPFLWAIVWGELVHVGKNATKGNGYYRICAE